MIRHSLTVLCGFSLLTVCGTVQAQSASVSGNWAGIFDVVHADGSVEPGKSFLVLSQKGSAISGMAGDSPDHLSPISSGSMNGNDLTLSIGVNAQVTVHMQLALEAGHLRGSATGMPVEPNSKVVVDAVATGSDWKPAADVPHVRDQLYETVAELDKKLFDAYNTCDLNTLGSLVSEDLEFYHDKTGLAVGRQTFIDSIKNNICGKVQRVLVPGTLEVHRLNGFGAVEIGVHTFHHPGDPGNVGIAKFITLWRLKDGAWQMTRAISYDHEPAEK